MTVAPTAGPDGAPKSFFWYDLETTGTHPPSDRVMQFAGLRTDAALQPEGEPLVLNARLAPDVLPSPEACLVTGMTPRASAGEEGEEGEEEWWLLDAAERAMTQPGTCVAGYNNLRFDDEFLRHGFYRNLIDPYAWAWRDGNSRWDLIDLARAAHALRPDGVCWPRVDGTVSFRLEALCAANGIAHEQPHSALADAQATLALARLLKSRQPRLWDYSLAHRSSAAARALLTPFGRKLCAHVSSRYANERACAAPVVAVASHPEIASRVIVADLSRDIAPLIEDSAEALRERLFAPGESAEERPPLKAVVLNRCPFLAPLNVVRAADAKRLGWDLAVVERRRQRLAETPALAVKLAEIYRRDETAAAPSDAELALYAGFLNDDDQGAAAAVREALRAGAPWPRFNPRDKRLRQLGTRLKARLRERELTGEERRSWRRHVRSCLADGFGRRPSLAAYRHAIDTLRAEETDAARLRQLDALAAYADAAEAAA